MATERLPITLPLKIVFPDGGSASGTLRYTVGLSRGLSDLLSKVDSGPVLFPDERPTPASAHQAAFWVHGGVGVHGKQPSHNRDVTLVANVRELPWRRINCGGYTSKKTGEAQALTGGELDLEVAVYERRTGKPLGKQTLTAPPVVCKDEIVKGAAGPESRAQDRDGYKFVETFFK